MPPRMTRLISIFVTCTVAGGCAGAGGAGMPAGPDAGAPAAPSAGSPATADAAAAPDSGCPGDVGTLYRVSATGTVIDFVSGAPHAAPVGVELGSWYATPPFCPEWWLSADGGGFSRSFTLRALLGAPILVARTGGVGPLTPVLSDQTATCPSDGGPCTIDDFTVPVLSTAVASAWRAQLAAGGMEDAGTRGLVLYEFREPDGSPAQGVGPLLDDIFAGPQPLAPGTEVRFLAADRRSLLPAGTMTTGESGAAIIALPGPWGFVSGERGGVTWGAVGVSTVPGEIFFEDARP